MKKFCVALTVALIVAASSFVEAATFSGEQIQQMLSITAQNPVAKQNKMLIIDNSAVAA